MKFIQTRIFASAFALLATVFFIAGPAAAPAGAQTTTSATLFGGCQADALDDGTKATNYSLYYENYKNENYEYALPNLRWILRCAPTYTGGAGDDRNLDRAVEIYAAMAEQASNEALATAYLDTALIVIEKAIPTLEANGVLGEGDRFEWTFKKGYFIQTHADVLGARSDEVVESYAAAYELSPDEIDAYYLSYLLRHYAATRDFGPLMDLLRDIEQNYADDAEKIALVDQYMAAIPPGERVAFLERRYEENPDDLDVMSQLFQIYQQQGNRAKLYELGERLSEMDPSPEVMRMLATMYLGDGRAADALEMYNDLLAMPNFEATADDYYNMGIANRQLGRLASARNYFRRTIDADPNNGQAYIAIGDLYVTAVSNCGGSDWQDRAVFWLAADYYQQAKSVDPSVAATANARLSTYRSLFPTSEELHFSGGVSAGDSYSIDYGCYSWIGETTTVR